MKTQNRMDKHVTFVAAINIAFGVLGVLIALIVMVGIAIGLAVTDDHDAQRILPIAGSAVVLFLLVTSIPEIIGGIGLLKRKPWARILILIVACLDLIWIPIGTVIGIYELWVLLQDETVRLFSGEGSA